MPGFTDVYLIAPFSPHSAAFGTRIYANMSSGGGTINLPSVTAADVGKRIWVKLIVGKSDGSILWVNAVGGQVIDGRSSYRIKDVNRWVKLQAVDYGSSVYGWAIAGEKAKVTDSVIDGTAYTTNATSTPIAKYGPFTKGAHVRAVVWAAQSSGFTPLDKAAKWVVELLVLRQGLSAAVIKDTHYVRTYKDQPAWDISFAIIGGTSDTLEVSVQGESGRNIDWRCLLEVSECL
jgi:hypothetical protein